MHCCTHDAPVKMIDITRKQRQKNVDIAPTLLNTVSFRDRCRANDSAQLQDNGSRLPPGHHLDHLHHTYHI